MVTEPAARVDHVMVQAPRTGVQEDTGPVAADGRIMKMRRPSSTGRLSDAVTLAV